MAKNNRSGGKFTGNHTSLVPAAAIVADICDQCEVVYRISPGFIKAGLRPVNGQRRVKITDSQSYILLAIRDNTSQQELHIYATDTQRAKTTIAEGAKSAGFAVSFKKD
jgi:hypothetical protein